MDRKVSIERIRMCKIYIENVMIKITGDDIGVISISDLEYIAKTLDLIGEEYEST